MGMAKNRADEVIVRSTIELSQRLGLRVVAEGVEDSRTWEALSTIGCEEAQGFYLQEALAPDRLTAWLVGEEAGARVAMPSFRPMAPAFRVAAA
jgi:EAL domain-containing protein (putative c-di-GMP-specific phosphodiesterase class I)